jgi:hypothetical protein
MGLFGKRTLIKVRLKNGFYALEGKPSDGEGSVASGF